MQSPESIPVLTIAVVVTVYGMSVIYRGWRKNRTLPTLLYAIMITFFSGIAWDVLLDQVYMPFRNLRIIFNGQIIWVSNILLTIFIAGGYLAWYFAVMYSQYNVLPTRTYFVIFLGGGAFLGDIVKDDWSAIIPFTVTLLAFGILIVEIMLYARRVLCITRDSAQRKSLWLYFVGLAVWILAGPVGLAPENMNLPSWADVLWVLPYSIGLVVVAYVVSRNPKVLFISEARPLVYLIFDHQTNLILTHKFEDYSKGVDVELLGSAMTGIVNLLREILGSTQRTKGIDHGDMKILVESGVKTTHLLITTFETHSLRQSLRNMVLEFETNFREELETETSLLNRFEPFRERVLEVFL